MDAISDREKRALIDGNLANKLQFPDDINKSILCVCFYKPATGCNIQINVLFD